MLVLQLPMCQNDVIVFHVVFIVSLIVYLVSWMKLYYILTTISLGVCLPTSSTLSSAVRLYVQWRNYRPCRPCNAGGPADPGAQSGCPKIFSDSALYCGVRHCSFKCFITLHCLSNKSAQVLWIGPWPFYPQCSWFLDFLDWYFDFQKYALTANYNYFNCTLHTDYASICCHVTRHSWRHDVW